MSGRHAWLRDSYVTKAERGVERVGLGDVADETSCRRSEEKCVMRNGVIDRVHIVW